MKQTLMDMGGNALMAIRHKMFNKALEEARNDKRLVKSFEAKLLFILLPYKVFIYIINSILNNLLMYSDLQ